MLQLSSLLWCFFFFWIFFLSYQSYSRYWLSLSSLLPIYMQFPTCIRFGWLVQVRWMGRLCIDVLIVHMKSALKLAKRSAISQTRKSASNIFLQPNIFHLNTLYIMKNKMFALFMELTKLRRHDSADLPWSRRWKFGTRWATTNNMLPPCTRTALPRSAT